CILSCKLGKVKGIISIGTSRKNIKEYSPNLRHGYQLILLIDHLLKHLQSSKKTIINKNTTNKLIISRLDNYVYLFILLFQNIFFKELSILFFFSCTFKSCYFFAIFIMNNCRRTLYVKFA